MQYGLKGYEVLQPVNEFVKELYILDFFVAAVKAKPVILFTYRPHYEHSLKELEIRVKIMSDRVL